MDKKEREKLKETLVTFLRQTSTLIGHCVFLEICGKLSVEMGLFLGRSRILAFFSFLISFWKSWNFFLKNFKNFKV